jgi:uncharacterized protein YggE
MKASTAAAMLGLAAALALPLAPAHAATLTLTAEARVLAVPDIAEIGAGVMTQAATAEAALADNARRMEKVVASLRAQGIAERDIQTSNLSVQPQFRYEPNREPVLTGFQARNQLRVILREPRRAGRIIDTLVREGANQIDGPAFRVDNPDPLLDRARQEAVRKARARAELYAAAAGLKVARITTITEGHSARPLPPPMPAPRMAMAAEAVADSPMLPGQLELLATVTMEFALE